jgi:hypothetical protein
MDAAKSATATFTALRTLTVARTGIGSGSVSSSPTGIDCGATCSGQFADGTAITLTADPSSGSTFQGWTGGGCSGTGPCTVTLGADTAVDAAFDQRAVPGPPLGKPPNTTIVKSKVNKKKGSAKFFFELAGTAKAGVTFECALVKKKKRAPVFKACTSPAKYKRLKPRRYLFEVRAVNEAGIDTTPATKRFKIT